MNNVSSSRLLLIAPKFFGYELDIVAELERQGVQVDMLQDRPFDSPLMKAVMRIRPDLGGYQMANRYFFEKIKGFGRSNYEYILVIQGEGVSVRTLSRLRVSYPKARIIFYTWDSIENKPFAKFKLGMYDRCSTFDPVDATKFGMSFRPLFFSRGFDCPSSPEYKYDLSFIGTIHSDRYQIVKKIVSNLPSDAHCFIYFYLQAPWMFDLRRVFTRTLTGAKRDEFWCEPLSKSKVQDVFFSSRTIMDIEHPNQRGATMRTFETLGSNRKMVTTNESLKNYDFYNPHNILIVDRKNPKVTSDFFRAPYETVPNTVLSKYTIQSWVCDVCGF